MTWKEDDLGRFLDERVIQEFGQSIFVAMGGPDGRFKNSVLVRFPGYYSPGEAPEKIARDDGSWCFSYCCGVVEESMTAAMKVIKNRDDFNEAMHHVKLSDETEPLQLTFLQKQVILTSHVRLHL